MNKINITTKDGLEFSKEIDTKEDFIILMENISSIASKIKIVGNESNSYANMDWMFSTCASLQSLRINNFDTSNTYSIIGLFSGCKSLKSLDISSFDFSNVEDAENMFRYCDSLVDLKFGKNLKISLNLSDSPLTHDSVMSVIDGLAEVKEKQILWLSKQELKLLSKEDIEKAGNKNWGIENNFFYGN